MLYYIKLSRPEEAMLEKIVTRDGRAERILYTSDKSRAKLYGGREDAERDAEIIPLILSPDVNGSVTEVA